MGDFLISGDRNFMSIREKIRSAKGKNVIFSSDDDELNRKILEKEKINVLLLNQENRKDKMKQRDSGFNHVLAKIAKKNNVILGINLHEILENKGKKKAEILARIRQNVKICSKEKLKMKFISAKRQMNPYDIKSLGLILGMPTWMTREL